MTAFVSQIVLKALSVTTGTGFAITVTVWAVVVQFASFTTTSYVPVPKLRKTLLLWKVWPLSTEYVTVPVPPEAVTVIMPSLFVPQGVVVMAAVAVKLHAAESTVTGTVI